MKIQVKKILSLKVDGACSYLLKIGPNIRILLDCGINHQFDFTAYQRNHQEIKSVQLILISHSSIQFCGALPFLIEDFGIDPNIVYTTQPIMRYAPLNIHEELLNFRHPAYNKKIFNKIYSYFQEIQLVKPYQKKVKQINQGVETDNQSISLLKSSCKTVFFSCYQAGGSLGNLCWKINMGLINILYLVEYTNYSLNHISGMDLQAIRAQQPISLLLTDISPQIDDKQLRKQKLYQQLKKVLLDFYLQCEVDPNRPRTLIGENDKRLLITCYPNQMLIQVMLTIKRIICQLQDVSNRQKIVVIHLSSRYLQLIKSQVQHFAEQYRPTIDKIDQFFVHSRSLIFRINVSTIHSISGILNQSFNNRQNIKVYHVGQAISNVQLQQNHKFGKTNLRNFKFFQQNQEQKQKLQKLNLQIRPKSVTAKIQDTSFAPKMQIQQDIQNHIIQNQSENLAGFQFQLQGMQEIQQSNAHPSKGKQQYQSLSFQPAKPKPNKLFGKYFSKISFPHFIKNYREEDFDYNQYGLKHHLQPSSRPLRKTINDFALQDGREEFDEFPDLDLKAKKSTVQVMNIQFQLPQEIIPFDYQGSNIKYLGHYVNRTNFSSTLQIWQILKPKCIVVLNTSKNQSQLFKSYEGIISNSYTNKICNISVNTSCILDFKNQLIQYKINYTPLNQTNLQKVKGRIQSINGVIHIHLQCQQERQILQFRLQKFFKMAKSEFKNCKFTGRGILVQGVKLYREKDEIILQGDYSVQYFKVRNLLYDFLGIKR